MKLSVKARKAILNAIEQRIHMLRKGKGMEGLTDETVYPLDPEEEEEILSDMSINDIFNYRTLR
jgi:hypothetical protein